MRKRKFKSGNRPKIFYTEPARWRTVGTRGPSIRWCSPESIYFHTSSPVCGTCGSKIVWTGDPEKRLRFWVYRIWCQGCGFDRIVSPFRLVMGQPADFWLSLGYTGGGLEEADLETAPNSA